MFDPSSSPAPEDGPGPRVLLDIDGVCADFLSAALVVIEEVTGRRYSPEDFEAWEIFDVVGAEHKTACYDLFKRPGFCAGIAPYPKTAEGAKRLRAIADVHVVTAPIHGPHWHFERIEWVRRHLGICHGDVTMTKHKALFDGDYLIEDKPSAVEAWAARHPEGLGLLWNQPYNRSSDIAARMGNVRRVSSWDEVIAVVELGQRR